MSGVTTAHRAGRGAALGIAVALAALLNVPGDLHAAPVQDDTTTSEADSSDVGDVAQETTEAPTTEAPTTTAAVPTTESVTEVPTTEAEDEDTESPATTPAEDDGDDDTNGDDVNWLLWGAIALGLLVAVVALSMFLSASRRRAQEAQAFRRRLAEVVGRAQWLHDDGSLAVLGASAAPERLRATWDDTHRRINDVSSQAAALAGNAPDDETQEGLRRLSQAASRLGGALDTHASLHMQMADDPSLQVALQGASETVMERRSDLDAATRPLADRL